MLLFHERLEEGFMLTPSIPMQLISCTIACIGFAMWFKVRGEKFFIPESELLLHGEFML